MYKTVSVIKISTYNGIPFVAFRRDLVTVSAADILVSDSTISFPLLDGNTDGTAARRVAPWGFPPLHVLQYDLIVDAELAFRVERRVRHQSHISGSLAGIICGRDEIFSHQEMPAHVPGA